MNRTEEGRREKILTSGRFAPVRCLLSSLVGSDQISQPWERVIPLWLVLWKSIRLTACCWQKNRTSLCGSPTRRTPPRTIRRSSQGWVPIYIQNKQGWKLEVVYRYSALQLPSCALSRSCASVGFNRRPSVYLPWYLLEDVNGSRITPGVWGDIERMTFNRWNYPSNLKGCGGWLRARVRHEPGLRDLS